MRDVASALDLPAGLAERLGDDMQRNLRIVERILELAQEHRRILVFAVSVRNAMLLAGVCQALGLDADAIAGTTHSEVRGRAIDRFKRRDGRTRVLVNYGGSHHGFRRTGGQRRDDCSPNKIACPL